MATSHTGHPLKRREDPKLITGTDTYVGDVRLPGALTMAVARSPHAHATIRSIATAAAAALPGVVAVFTAEDVNAAVGVILDESRAARER